MNFEDYLKLDYTSVNNQNRTSVAHTNPFKNDDFDEPIFDIKDLDEKVRYDRVLSQDESIIQTENNDSEQELSFLEKTINKFFSIGEIREKADANGDGEVTEEEAKEYLKEIAARDGNTDDLTFNDIDAELEAIGVNLDEISEGEDEESVEETAIPETETPAQVSRVRTNNGESYVKSEEINPLLGMNLEELEAEKEVRANTLKEKQQAVNDIHSGKNEKVKAANDKLDKAREEYSKALEEDPNMKKYKKEIEKQIAQEKQLNLAASENEIKINNITVEISKKENVILDLEASIAASESKLSSLKISGKEEDKEKDAKIKAQKKELEQKISSAKKQLKEEKSNLEKLNKDLEKLNKQKAEIQKQIEENNKAQAKSQELVNKYANKTTKAKMEAYNKAVKNVEKVKADELKVANEALQNAQESLTEVEAMISAVKYRDANSVVEKAIAIAYEELRKGVHEETGNNDGADVRRYTRGHHYAWCAAFTSYCYGDGQSRNNEETFGYQAGVRNIKAQAQRAGYYSNGANYTPQRGDLIVYGDGSHTGIVVEVNPDGSYKTIEGNTSNAVKMKSHQAHSSNVSFVRMGEWIERA